MPSIVIWNSTTKELVQSTPQPVGISYTEDMLDAMAEGIVLSKALDPVEHSWALDDNQLTTNDFRASMYVDANDVITLRPEQSTVVDKLDVIANGTDVIVLTGLPDPCMVEAWFGDELVITPTEVVGGTESINFDFVGTYSVKVVTYPYLNWEVQINAT